MSFITKRERVFNDYDLYDLPARNEGKLKAYASCTDARAWSHFGSDKSEHLVEVIKRNNDVCRPKYVPTEAIVNTLLAHKQAEIARLKRKIEEFEQIVAAYDDLELSYEQKCEIAKAHAAIKEANKDLNELWFDLDLSGYTGIDSEDYETGHSRGDEPSKRKRDDGEDSETPRSKKDDGEGDDMVSDRDEVMGEEWVLGKEPRIKYDIKAFSSSVLSKGIQAGQTAYITDACTNAIDPRLQELQDVIIAKDAKLGAMWNTIAVIENDVCEPYNIYAHIYTALEKIFGILCQNDKYKLYLNFMTAGKDIRAIDIKGKILFKIKVLEKFSLALIAPCSQELQGSSNQECSCYRAELVSSVETAYALTSSVTQKPIDTKRAQLVADIMENEEMIELLNRDIKEHPEDSNIGHDDFNQVYNIENENLKRLKNLQQNYDDLMNCYEALKHEKDCLLIRCQKYEELEKDFLNLQTQLREYNSLWNEKEHYRKRSIDLDTLKEQYLVLCDETTGLETQLKAENEINDVKSKTINELRNDNLALEKQLNEATVAFEKELNSAQCKLKESECTIMCQGQQIKSLSIQIDNLLEQNSDKVQFKQSDVPVIHLIDEINSLKEQIKNLQDALYCSEEEKKQFQDEYQNKLNLINDLRMRIEDWKGSYEKILQRNNQLEKYTDGVHEELHNLKEENKTLSQEIDHKSNALDNLRNVLNNKSKENHDLYEEINSLHKKFDNSLSELHNEKQQVMRSLQIAKKESDELLEKVNQHKNTSNLYEKQTEECNRLKTLLSSTQQENEYLKKDLNAQNSEIKKIQELNQCIINNIRILEDENNQYNSSLELKKKESKLLEDKLHDLEELSSQYQQLQESHENLIKEKCKLEMELNNKAFELNSAVHNINLTKKKSQELEVKLKSSENLKADFNKVESEYNMLIEKQQILQSELDMKKQEFDSLLKSYNNLKNNLSKIRDQSSKEVEDLTKEKGNLKKYYDNLLVEKNALQKDYICKIEEIDYLSHSLKSVIDKNQALSEQLHLLELTNKTVQSSMDSLQEEHFATNNTLNALRNESAVLKERLNKYEFLQSKYDFLKKDHERMELENNKLVKELEIQKANLKIIAKDNEALNSESQHLLSHSEDLEKALIDARTKLVDRTNSPVNLHMGIIKQIEEMKKEKIENAIKIRDLLDKLDESETYMADLSEKILARDEKIAILENHINELQDEVKQLHESLAEMVDTGEQIKDLSLQKITESLNTMEAHHSKATHNMKMELAKLQSDNVKLEERLSISKIRSEDSARDKHKYISQIINLQNEKEIIITDIKQLEVKSVGDSELSPEHCKVEDILGSLERISRFIDTRCSKSTSLEQTLLKVQSSYQVVQSKADEAKKIVEKEKEKILNEKEEAVRERINMEKQLTDLKKQLKMQVLHDREVIKDLEAEILNQKLICDQLNTSTQTLVSKLKEEIQSLQDLYKKSLETIFELEEKNRLVSDEGNKHLDTIVKVTNSLQEQNKEIEKLKKDLESLQNVPSKSVGTQALINCINNETQTIDKKKYEGFDTNEDTSVPKSLDGVNKIERTVNLEKKAGYISNPKHTADIHVLVANVEPTYNYDANRQINHNFMHLSLRRLEQYSISGLSENDTELGTKDLNLLSAIDRSNKQSNNGQSIENMNFIDIYNKQTIRSNSSKNIGNDFAENEIDSKSPANVSAAEFALTIESSETKNSMHKTSQLFGSISGVSADRDLFVIYKDSETNSKKTRPVNGHSELLIETVTIQPDRFNAKSKRKQTLQNYDEAFSYQEDYELIEDDSVKHKLNINMPRVYSDNPSIDIFSHEENKSFTVMNHSISCNIIPYVNSNNSSENDKLLDVSNREPNCDTSMSVQVCHLSNENGNLEVDDHNAQNIGNSYHKLFRTDADVRLIKSKTSRTDKKESSVTNIKKPDNFKLDYIHATDDINSYDAAVDLRKTRSDKLVGQKNTDAKMYSKKSKSNGIQKTTLSDDDSHFIVEPILQSKVYMDRDVMVKLDTIEEYESQIKILTRNLENIERDYKKKIEVIKNQYDSNIKSILNEHNEGVKSIQDLHEDTLQDIIKNHENEVENLRSMSMEAMKKADKLEKEMHSLKYKTPKDATCFNEDPREMATREQVKQRQSRVDTKTLTKTNVEAFNVRPKSRSSGPCTCTLNINLSDTIRNIFEQVDVDQRKDAEQAYLKYIANKILNSTVEALDYQELSFLHLKVCRIWKVKLSKEETLQKRISSLEAEVIKKQRHNHHTIAELDRQVAKERRRLQEVREAVCRNSPTVSRFTEPGVPKYNISPPDVVDVEYLCRCEPASCSLNVGERKSAGDLVAVPTATGTLRQKRTKPESRKAVLAKMDGEDRREKKLYNDEPPTRLRRPHDRHPAPAHRPTKK